MAPDIIWSCERRSVLAPLSTRCVFTLRVIALLRRGEWVIHFALQALQLYATPANPSPHTTSVRAKLYKPLIGFRRAFARRSVAVSHAGTRRWYGTYSVVRDRGIGHLDARRISTAYRECGPLGSERPVSGSGA